MLYEVCVELKPEVLDTEGRAIQESLIRLGRREIQSLKSTKRFILELADDCPNPDATAQELAKDYLSNPISEQFSVKRI